MKKKRKVQTNSRLYTLEVKLAGGPVTEQFLKDNPVISRTIQIRGNQTLAVLHDAIYDAFGRDDEHLYEFHLKGEDPYGPNAEQYVHPVTIESPLQQLGMGSQPAGIVTRTTINSLNLKKGQSFGYLFDFGDDWYHRIKVIAIDEKTPAGKYPKVTERVGKNPPQYIDWDEDDIEDEDEDEDDVFEEEEDAAEAGT